MEGGEFSCEPSRRSLLNSVCVQWERPQGHRSSVGRSAAAQLLRPVAPERALAECRPGGRERESRANNAKAPTCAAPGWFARSLARLSYNRVGRPTISCASLARVPLCCRFGRPRALRPVELCKRPVLPSGRGLRAAARSPARSLTGGERRHSSSDNSALLSARSWAPTKTANPPPLCPKSAPPWGPLLVAARSLARPSIFVGRLRLLAPL